MPFQDSSLPPHKKNQRGSYPEMFFRFFRVVKMSAESNKGKSKCYFKDNWLQHKDYKNWITKVPDDDQKAYCTVCVTAILLSGLGI